MLSANAFARTVEQLLGVPVSDEPPPADAPPEGWLAVQQASPDLLLHFRETARRAVRQALAPTGPLLRIEAENVGVPAARLTIASRDDAVLITPEDTSPESIQRVPFRFSVAQGGAYVVRLYAASVYLDANLVTTPGRSVDLKLGAVTLARQALPFFGEEVPQVDVPVTLPPGEVVLEVSPVWEPDRRRSGVALDAIELRAADPAPASTSRAALVPCAGAPDAACVREAIARFVPRAFRRPATAAEVDRYVGLADSARALGADGDEALALALEAVLASPAFVFLPPGGTPPERARAIAARLAQLVWHRGPDAALDACAAQGLDTLLGDGPCGLAAQLQRMLDHPDAMAFARSFSEDWLGLAAARRITPPPMLFAGFRERVREAAFDESASLVAALAREDRPLTEAITSSRAMLDSSLASLYRLPSVPEGTWQTLPPERRGVLGQTSVLLATSFPLRTSPTRRGAWILDRLMCRSLGPPALPALQSDDLTQSGDASRELTPLRTMEGCRGCHAILDPLGDALEGFDSIGRTRPPPAGHSTAGALTDPTLEWSDAASLATALANHPAVAPCLARRLFAHAIGRAPGADDAETLATLTQDVRTGTRRALVTLVRSPAFRWGGP